MQEIAENWDEYLCYEVEHQLGSKPNIVDLLIIKKKTDITIPLPFLNNFRAHNLIEFKSPDDNLNINDFFMGLAYISEYKSHGSPADERKPTDLTMTFLREKLPVGLLESLADLGASINNKEPGVYIIGGIFPFLMQIVAYKDLQNHQAFLWLRALTRDLSQEDALNLLEASAKANDSNDQRKQNNIDSILFVCGKENHDVFTKLYRESDMIKLNSLKFIFADELKDELKKEEAKIEARSEARTIIRMGRKFGMSDSDLIAELVESLACTAEEAGKMLCASANNARLASC